MALNPSTLRRPLNLEILEPFVDRKKLRAPGPLGDHDQSVTLTRDDFVPVVQAEVGSAVAVPVYRYRLLIPMNQVLRGPGGEIQRTAIASAKDIHLIWTTIVRHFGGFTTTIIETPTLR